MAEARRLEPNLAPNICSVYRVPDSCVDGFRLVWHNALCARRYGGDILTYHEVIAIKQSNGKVTGVRARNRITGEELDIACGTWSMPPVPGPGRSPIWPVWTSVCRPTAGR